MAAPVKQGVQGGDSMENEAERPKFDLWLPRCLFGFFLGTQKEARRRSGETPRPGAQAPPHRALVWWTAKENGIPLPRLLRHSQRSRVVEVTTRPAPHRATCAPPHTKARVQMEEPPCWETHAGSGSGGGGNVNPHPTRAFASTCHAP